MRTVAYALIAAFSLFISCMGAGAYSLKINSIMHKNEQSIFAFLKTGNPVVEPQTAFNQKSKEILAGFRRGRQE